MSRSKKKSQNRHFFEARKIRIFGEVAVSYSHEKRTSCVAGCAGASISIFCKF